MIMSRPVAPRATWTASMVDSVPEFVKRHCGRPKRRCSSSATAIEWVVGAAKWVPRSTWRLTASTISRFAWPTHITPKPLWKSMYSFPSTSQTCAPVPRSTYTGQGSFSWKEEGTPFGITFRARSYVSPERGVRSANRSRWRLVNSASRRRSISGAGVVAAEGSTLIAWSLHGAVQVPAERSPLDLAARGLGQLVHELDHPWVLVGGGFGLHVVLELRGERGAAGVPRP